MLRFTLLLLLALLQLLSRGLASGTCDHKLQRQYCTADYGGDLHTACRYCGIGLQCPGTRPSGRGLADKPEIMAEILRRHNDYREQVREVQRFKGKNCIPELR